MEQSEFVKRLTKSIEPVHFRFQKKDGSIRHARGTLNKTLLQSILPAKDDDEEEKPKRKRPDNLVVYFDIESNAWRSFLWENFISVGDV